MAYESVEFGVLTATDDVFLPGALMLVESAVRFGCDVTVVDLKLSETSRRRLVDAGGKLRCPPSNCAMPDDIYGWQTWNKPFYLIDSPYKSTLWLDADCLMVQSPDKLFNAISRGPLMLQHWNSRAYEWPEEAFWTSVNVRCPSNSLAVNAGVLGFSPDRFVDGRLLKHWCELVSSVVDNSVRRRQLRWHDESALNYLLARDNSHDLITRRNIVTDGWNRLMPADVWYGDDRSQFNRIIEKSKRTQDVIMHFTGGTRPRYWFSWIDNVVGSKEAIASIKRPGE